MSKELDLDGMKDTKFMTADEKRRVLRAWERFLRGLARGLRGDALVRLFTKDLYNHLIQHCSFIAHYNRGGFFATYFEDPEDTIRFLSQFDGRATRLSVEYGMDYWYKGEEYGDINEAMIRLATPFIDGIVLGLSGLAKERDLATARQLQAKWIEGACG